MSEDAETKKALARLRVLDEEASARRRGGCECGHGWSEHTPNLTTQDWMECDSCHRPCFID